MLRDRDSEMLDILLVDDEPDFRIIVGDALRDAGHRVTLAANGAEGLTLISSNVFDVMICDIRLPKVDGLTLFRRVRQESPGTDVILITAHAAVSDAVAALKEGATDYLTKPFDIDEIVLQMERIAVQRALKRELEQARAELLQRKATGAGAVAGAGAIIGRSPSMLRLLDRIETIAQSDAPVLITGESGTGKELVARTLHDRSTRRAKPFIAVNCAAFPETLLEAELFGHERGAFTGAVKRRDGRFKAADGGTLLLDEIAEVPLPAQAKLLRVLQEGTVEPLGTNEVTRVDVRIISATHRNLRERIKEGRFREDLYYRLNVLDIEIPPLRERRGDLPLLLQYFLTKFAPPAKPPATIAPRAWAVLSQYHFPGNVREFAHAIEHAVVLAGGGEIDVEHLPAGITGTMDGTANTSAGNLRSLSAALKEFEHEYLMRALAQANGKKMKAAEILGISRKNLWEKLRLHGIAAESEAEE
jgi:DNA-binding NtrC family response regulator